MNIVFKKKTHGFTLVEVLVGAAVFLIVSLSAYNAYISLFKLVDMSQYRILATALANEQFEIARNMPYNSVGIVNGIPSGSIPQTQNITRGGVAFVVTTIVRSIDLPFDGTFGGSPNDLSPSDSKLFEVTVTCTGCNNMQPIKLSGQIAPRDLEIGAANGALLIQVFDSNGQPVQNAAVHITHTASSTIIINDVTDADGKLQLVDIPPALNKYRISVTKAGYSTDRTYPIGGVGNPSPTKPDATVLVQQVTQISFAIDELSSLVISSVTPTCTAVGNIDFSLVGAKNIGYNVPKYAQNLVTNGSGRLTLSSMEWDTFTLALTDGTYDLIGLNPLNPMSLNPDTTQNLQIIVAPKDPRSFMVTVKDNVTLLPLTGATVHVTSTGGYDETFTTGRGYLAQSDWSGGSGQASSSDPTTYWSDDGNVDVTEEDGQVLLREVFGEYRPSGWLESFTFDTGSISNFYSLVHGPSDQPMLTGSDSARFQFATNPEITATTTWNFLGPDGTAATYYTAADASLSTAHNGGRYARYKLFLSTATPTSTPNISDVSFTYTSDCVPPGQVIFTNLPQGTYTVTVSKDGYTTYTGSVTTNNDWQEHQVLLGP